MRDVTMMTLSDAVGACITTGPHVHEMLVASMAGRWLCVVQGNGAASVKLVLDGRGTVVSLSTLPRADAVRFVTLCAPWALRAAHVEMDRLVAMHCG